MKVKVKGNNYLKIIQIYWLIEKEENYIVLRIGLWEENVSGFLDDAKEVIYAVYCRLKCHLSGINHKSETFHQKYIIEGEEVKCQRNSQYK